ncbi:hypothetical protein SEA_SHAM_42 [Streptomyces phage Sham]|jgi:predicted nuclease with TOPRIM domain|uniref:Uncharacterized protein n=1 Tax=Streptomyces phage TunaTartare TaxID=2848887 RepID=A0A8F2E6J6_9CAUD|nr:hypothetical protein PP457_gp206 [Streptomyces phage TunaTartare]QWT29936.1 hypothetical protein SEA_TUNATARTARE_44 [Streptomyces phage TunaTartare]UUG69377.1 hypothetical protein SEA_SHAM_42 [Streptomyces phage Sham]
MDNLKRLNLTVTALKQSLAAKVADYEEQLANIRAEASILLEENADRISELEQQVQDLRKKLDDFGVKDTENEDVAVQP